MVRRFGVTKRPVDSWKEPGPEAGKPGSVSPKIERAEQGAVMLFVHYLRSGLGCGILGRGLGTRETGATGC